MLVNLVSIDTIYFQAIPQAVMRRESTNVKFDLTRAAVSMIGFEPEGWRFRSPGSRHVGIYLCRGLEILGLREGTFKLRSYNVLVIT